MRRLLLGAALVASLLAVAPAAHAQVRDPVRIGNAALDWAEQNAINAPYSWGGTGPAYDCSGLVITAFAHEGISLPHYTGAMVASGKLVRTWNPKRGDLAFWGDISSPYHVEFVTSWDDHGFGAESPGWDGRVTWHSWGYFAPSAFYEVVG